MLKRTLWGALYAAALIGFFGFSALGPYVLGIFLMLLINELANLKQVESKFPLLLFGGGLLTTGVFIGWGGARELIIAALLYLLLCAFTLLRAVQPALLDRMEVIDVTGYTIEEKVEIAKQHLVPKQLDNHGINKDQFSIAKPTLKSLVEGYTRESGVRNLDKKVAKLVRSTAKDIALGTEAHTKVNVDRLEEILGPPRERDIYEGNNHAGVVTGLAWTPVGGDILFIESSVSKGNGKVIITGNLGDVMKESATIAIAYLKANADELGIDQNLFKAYDINIHVPQGAIPKDGPSAGITLLTALTSLFTQKKVAPKLAMTGEITLRGRVLPVGGIKEKILAAKRAKISTILLCEKNRKDIEEIEAHYLKGMTFHYISEMSEVLDLAILNQKVKGAKTLSAETKKRD